MGEKFYNVHHCVPRSRNGSNIRENKVKLDARVHQALHMIFANQTPIEQMQRLIGINSTALSNEFKEDVKRILTIDDPEYTYVRGILHPKK